MQASRYLFVPLAWLVILGAGPLGALPFARWVWMGAVGILLLWAPRTAARVWDFKDDVTLLEAELQVEPENPYARATLARHHYVAGKDRPSTLRDWERALADLPPAVKLPDRAAERWNLAQAAFLGGNPTMALEQLNHLRKLGGAPPPQAGCLEADALDALGRHEEAAAVAAERCKSP